MADIKEERKKRKHNDSEQSLKKQHTEILPPIVNSPEAPRAGKIHRICVRNFMCHDALEIILNPNVNFIIGRNGSGKSALLTALTIGLGARAGVTNRGNSVKDFIKKGKNSATIEVNIINEGPMAYKWEEYGDMITVVRQIGTTSSYKLKNAQGKTISTKKDELEHITSKLNIQVENPISVLNQDVSREFLVTANPTQKYQLFMKATQMDVIGNNYKEAQLQSEEARRRLLDAEAYLADSEKEVQSIEKSLKMLESVEATRVEFHSQQLELYWATAIAEEKKLQRIKQTLENHQKSLDDIESVEGMRETKEKSLTAEIEERQQKIRETKAESADSASAFQAIKERYMTDKETFSNKSREWKTSQTTLKRTETDLAMVCQEIKRLESTHENDGEKARLKQQHAKLKQDLEDVEAMLRTKQTDQMHLQTDKLRLEQEDHSTKVEVNHCENRVRKSKQRLSSLKQQSDSSVTVFGANVPRLLKRIDEEHKRGRFQKKPIGPLGAYIKVKDPTWTPVVENYLGFGTLGAFAVDNAQDAKMLGAIMREVYRGLRIPMIIASKFIPKVHDVSRFCTYSENYVTLLDVMEISEPVVANCLIDQREPECVMLIPTSKEASDLLSDRRRVPPNCRRGLTKNGDEFFPDPNYRSYGGKVGRSKYLQVSTSEAIQAENEELVVAEDELSAAVKRQRVIRDKLQRTLAELGQVTQQVMKLRSIQTSSRAKIDALADELAIEEPDGTGVFVTEKAVLEKKLVEQKEVEVRLCAETEELRTALKSLEEEVKRHREIMHSVDDKVNKLKDEIRKLDDEKEMLKLNSQHANRKLLDARQAVQKAVAEYDIQKRVTDKLVADAENQCPRMETERTVDDIRRMSAELKAKISAVERKVGSKEELEVELAEKQEKFNVLVERTDAISACNDRHLIRVQQRRQVFKDVKRKVSENVQTAFASILKLRQYTGSLKISHSSQTIELEVTPQNTARKTVNDARTLSGGERSYSTVAFILALWDCTGLPFYFLDEFDVFMDKVNRRIIMDILLDHTRSHPQSQFTFLTPLETSIVQVDDYVTIHQLAPPERAANSQN